MIDFKKLTKKQKAGRDILLSNKYKEILFDGGSRSGKTFLILMTFIILCGRYNGIRILIARLRFAHAKSSLWLQTLIPLLQYCFSGLEYSVNRSDFIVKIGNSEIWLGGLDDKERTDKILGQEYAVIFLNEAVRIAKSTRDKVKTRLAQKIEGFKNFLIYDCNPRHPLHYLYQEFYIEKSDKKYQLHWMPEDNIENLADGYIEDTLETLKGHEYQRFRLGQWCSLPGAVYRNVKAENIIDINKDVLYYDDITIGIDFGLYSAICIWGIKDDKAYCIQERIIMNGTTSDIIRELDSIWQIKKYGYMLYCDHEPDRIQEIADAGFNTKKAHKDVSAGDATVNGLELYFDNQCQNTFQSMLNLIHQQDNNDVYIEKHVKENDHEADASRYALHSWKMENSGSEPIFTSRIM